MTREKYLEMCERMGDEPDPDKIPPDFDDFPPYVHVAFEIFNLLPDRFTSTESSMIFVGKDLAPLHVLYDVYMVASEDRLKVLNVIKLIDDRARTKSIKEANKKRASK